MPNLKTKITFHKVLGVVFVVFGVLMYPTPFPGTSFLIILGLVWFMGKRKTTYYLRRLLSKKIFKFLHVKEVMEEIE